MGADSAKIETLNWRSIIRSTRQWTIPGGLPGGPVELANVAINHAGTLLNVERGKERPLFVRFPEIGCTTGELVNDHLTCGWAEIIPDSTGGVNRGAGGPWGRRTILRALGYRCRSGFRHKLSGFALP